MSFLSTGFQEPIRTWWMSTSPAPILKLQRKQRASSQDVSLTCRCKGPTIATNSWPGTVFQLLDDAIFPWLLLGSRTTAQDPSNLSVCHSVCCPQDCILSSVLFSQLCSWPSSLTTSMSDNATISFSTLTFSSAIP